MKTMILLLACLALVPLTAETVLAPDHLVREFSRVYKTQAFSLKGDVLQIKGQPHLGEQQNSQQKLICQLKSLEGQKLAGRTLLLSFEGKLRKNSGRLEICIRTVDAQGQSIGYPGLTFRSITKNTDWKTFTKEITLPPNTHACYFFIWARYLEADDDVQLKNITIRTDHRP